MFNEMKAAIENDTLEGQFGYDDQYADYVNDIYIDAVEEASKRVDDDIFIEPLIQCGYGGVFMSCKKGRTDWDFEDECETLYALASEAESEEEFKEAIVNFLLGKYEDCYPEEDEDDEDDDDEDPDYEGCEEDDED